MARLVPSAESIDGAIGRLFVARDEARNRMHLFSVAASRAWRELEQEIDSKLVDLEHRLDIDGETATQITCARAEEMTLAVRELLRRNAEHPVRYFMSAGVHTCRAHDSLERVAQILWERDCGIVPVVDDADELVGVVTDRDVCMAAYTQGERLAACVVSRSMSKPVHACSADDSLSRVAEIMRAHRVRRVPVVDGSSRLIGVVALADVARYLNSLPEEHPSRALLVRTLAAISEARDERA